MRFHSRIQIGLIFFLYLVPDTIFILQYFGASDFADEVGNFQSIIAADEDDCFKVEGELKTSF